jgi:hypothetical protein
LLHPLADYRFDGGHNEPYSLIPLKHWCIFGCIDPKYGADDFTQLLNGLRKADLNRNSFDPPKIICKLDGTGRNFDVPGVVKTAISKSEWDSYQIVVFVLPRHEDRFYQMIKRFGCQTGRKVTQCVLQSNLYGNVNQALYQGLYLQMLTKTSSTVLVVDSPAWQIAEIRRYNPAGQLLLSKVLTENEAIETLKAKVTGVLERKGEESI